MAEIFSIQSGNWSNGATWWGGYVPASGDVAHIGGRFGNHTVSVDVYTQVSITNVYAGSTLTLLANLYSERVNSWSTINLGSYTLTTVFLYVYQYQAVFSANTGTINFIEIEYPYSEWYAGYLYCLIYDSGSFTFNGAKLLFNPNEHGTYHVITAPRGTIYAEEIEITSPAEMRLDATWAEPFTIGINKFTAVGDASNAITILNTSADSEATLSTIEESIICDYLNLTNVPVNQLNTWYAGQNSIDNGGNTNWLFKSPNTSYIICSNTEPDEMEWYVDGTKLAKFTSA